MIEWAKGTYTELNGKYPTHTKLARYLIAGGTAAFTNIALIFVFTDLMGIWYIVSGILSFIIAFFVSFTLQKFWTFGDTSREGMHRQAATYLAVAVANLLINTGLLYVFVEYGGLHYLVSQIIAGALIAIESFFIYQFFIFRKRSAIDLT